MMNKVSNVAVLILSAILGIILYLAFWPTQVMKPNIQPYKISQSVIEAGQVIYFTADYCKFKPLPARVNRSIIDTNIIFLAETVTNLDTGCKKANTFVLIPLNTPPGTYYIQSTLTYRLNPIHEVSYRLVTEKFEVTNKCLTDKVCP